MLTRKQVEDLKYCFIETLNGAMNHYFNMEDIQIATGKYQEIVEDLALPTNLSNWKANKNNEFYAFLYKENCGNIFICYLLLVDENFVQGVTEIWAEVDNQVTYADDFYIYDNISYDLGQGHVEDYFKSRSKNIKQWNNVDDIPKDSKWYELDM